MKVKLLVSHEKYDETKNKLAEYGIELDDDAELVLCEKIGLQTHLQ